MSLSNAVAEFAKGGMVIIMDDESRENEGDLVVAAELISSEQMAFMIRHTTGIICAPMTRERAFQLNLSPMVASNQDPKGTSFTVTCDGRNSGTGVSAVDRTKTVKVLCDDDSKPGDLTRPGHIFPLIGHSEGLRGRRGHTEASLEMCKLAGLKEVAVIGELTNDDGTMMRYDDCLKFSQTHNIPIITIDSMTPSSEVQQVANCTIHLKEKQWTLSAYQCNNSESYRVLIREPLKEVVKVRIHSECFTGDVLGSSHCDCGEQLQQALSTIEQEGGVIIFPPGHEGRGIGLTNKIRAYDLMNKTGMNTYEANLALGFEEDARSFDECKLILEHLGIKQVHLLSSNPKKISALGELVVNSEALVCVPNEYNSKYLADKRERHGEKKVLTGMPNMPSDAKAQKLRICILRSSWHSDLLDEFEKSVRLHLNEMKITDIETVLVPGTYEIVYALSRLDGKYDAVLCLGILIKGETGHFDYVSQGVVQAITRYNMMGIKPIINGVFNCYSYDQAKERCLKSYDLSRELARSLASTTVYMASNFK